MPNDETELDRAWRARMGDKLWGQFLDALAVGGWTHEPHDVLDGVLAGRFQLHDIAGVALAVTEIVRYPRCRALHVCWVAGDMAALLGPLLGRLKEYGRAQGCDRLTGMGRPGWARGPGRLAGFRAQFTAVRLDLDEQEEEQPREAAPA